MKKLIISIAFMVMIAPMANAIGFSTVYKAKIEKEKTEDVREIRDVFRKYVEFENLRDLKGIDKLHSDEYMTVDAMPKNVYLDIIDKTWKRYSDIKHSLKIKSIKVNGDYATAEVEETLYGTTTEKIEDKTVVGDLKSVSNVIYYLQKHKNSWKFLSDYVVDEQTFLLFDSAKEADVTFYAPKRILADKEYVATLNISSAPRNSLIIATIGQEKIIYPHKSADEVYRKVPDNGMLERVFKSNTDNLNEYVVATYCLTKPRLTEDNQIETLLTGVGYIINRVNVVPENKFITVNEDGKKEEK